MKPITITVIIVLGALLAASAVTAQNQRGAHRHQMHADSADISDFFGPEGRLERLTRKLDLTDEQQTTIAAIFEQGEQQGVALRKDMMRLKNQLDGEMLADEPSETTLVDLTEKIGAVRTDLQVLRLKTRLAVRAELTDEQRDEWLLEGRGRGRGGKRSARGGAPRFPGRLHGNCEGSQL